MASYFTTVLPDSVAPASIILPDVPVLPIREATLDEMASEPVISGTYDLLTLKRTFEAGLNTICLPFQVDDVAAIFGEGAQAYEFYGLTGSDLDFVKTESLAAGVPYIISLPEAIADDIVLANVTIDEANVQAGSVDKYGTSFRGTYRLTSYDTSSTGLRRLNADGTLTGLSPDELVCGFRAVFYIPTDGEATVRLYDDATGIAAPLGETATGTVYNLAGQKLSHSQSAIRDSQLRSGVYITGGKKIIKK